MLSCTWVRSTLPTIGFRSSKSEPLVVAIQIESFNGKLSFLTDGYQVGNHKLPLQMLAEVASLVGRIRFQTSAIGHKVRAMTITHRVIESTT